MHKNTEKHAFLKEFLKNKYQFRYNEVVLTVEYASIGSSKWSQVAENDLWDEIRDEVNEYDYSINYLCLLLGSKRFAKAFNPIKEFLRRAKIDQRLLPFDLKEYNPFEQLTSFVRFRSQGEQEAQRFCLALTRWFVSAIKCLYEPLYASKQCLVLMGPQSIGKTPFIRSLLPLNLQCFIKSNPNLSPFSKDARIALSSNFVIEIDEVDDWLKAKDNRDRYKEYMTTTFVNERLPYAKTASSLQRISSFLGTCNEAKFLSDPTSTDRWVVFEVDGFSNKHSGSRFCVEDFPIEACWAYAYELYKEGFDPCYRQEELKENDRRNEKFKYNTFEFEVLEDYLEPSNPEDGEFMKSSDIAFWLNEQQAKVVFTAAQLGRALVRLRFRRVYYERRYGYWVKKIRK